MKKIIFLILFIGIGIISICAQDGIIDANYIQKSLPINLQHILRVNSIQLNESYKPTIEAFDSAVTIFAQHIESNKVCDIVFATYPFSLNFGQHNIKLTSKVNDLLGISLIQNNLIFYDITKIKNYEFDFQVVCFLEELVHLYCGTYDEWLARNIVSLLYPKVVYENGVYKINPNYK